jgi:hypothetical protein
MLPVMLVLTYTRSIVELKTYLNWISIITGVSGTLAVAALLLTNPSQIGPVGVTIWFIALFLALQGATTLGLFSWYGKSLSTVGPYQRLTAALRQGLLLGGIVTILLALSSLRQLSIRDAGLLITLAVLVELFFRARNR